MQKNEINLTILWAIYTLILFLAMDPAPAFCTGICTPGLSKSAAGQASQQIAAALSLDSSQAGELKEITEEFREEFQGWLASQDGLRDSLLETLEQANADGTISRDERRIIQEKMQALKDGRFSMFIKAFFAAGSIDNILMEEQKERLQALELALVIPGDVIDSLKAFDTILHGAMEEIEESGGLTGQTWSELQGAWDDLLNTAYLPDPLKKRLTGRLLQAVKTSSLKTKIPASAILPGLEKFELIIDKIIEAAEEGAVNPMSLLADINGLTGIGSRLLLLSNTGKRYFFEVFMLGPAFSCQL